MQEMPIKARTKPGEIARAAAEYALHGWSVIPVEPHGKRPIVAWQEFQRRVATREEIVAWFQHWPQANVAVITGAVSGLIVLDVDPQHGGAESIARIERAHEQLPETIEAATGGGGRHVYFAHPGGVVRNAVGLEAGIDLRGDGGCVVAPPSIHPNGKRYAWVPARTPGEIALAPMPRWLLSLLREDERRGGHPREHWRELVRAGVRSGERNNTIASFAGHHRWHGVDPEVVLELLLTWNRSRCEPPLSDDEVARTVDSIVRLHERDDRGNP
jgi:hypothetical protein